MNPLIHELFQKTRLLSKELNNTLKQFDLFAAQWTVIYCVHEHGEMTLTRIWKYLNVEAPTITRTVNRLEQMGWLETSVGMDRREKVVRLSGKAIERMADIEQSIIQFEENALRNLSKDEEELLKQLLKKFN